ncbi:MAG: hypothetical protein WC966_05915 [Bradymonadales bacterium]|jgi:hypothetical protein
MRRLIFAISLLSCVFIIASCVLEADTIEDGDIQFHLQNKARQLAECQEESWKQNPLIGIWQSLSNEGNEFLKFDQQGRWLAMEARHERMIKGARGGYSLRKCQDPMDSPWMLFLYDGVSTTTDDIEFEDERLIVLRPSAGAMAIYYRRVDCAKLSKIAYKSKVQHSLHEQCIESSISAEQ